MRYNGHNLDVICENVEGPSDVNPWNILAGSEEACYYFGPKDLTKSGNRMHKVYVKNIQEALRALNYDVVDSDGIFDEKLKNQVMDLQRIAELTADGIVGIATKRILLQALLGGGW